MQGKPSGGEVRVEAPENRAPFSWLRRDVVFALLLAVGTLVIYAPIRHGEFLMDDGVLLTNNSLIKQADGWWPRMPFLENRYLQTFNASGHGDLPVVARFWQLTNTRYILADARVAQLLNQSASPGNPFVVRFGFTFTGPDGQLLAKPGIKQIEDSGDVAAQLSDKGPFALIEFTDALPRAKLYANWKSANDDDALGTLRSPAFDPFKTVLVSSETPVTQASGSQNADPGTVTITSYEPKDVKLKAHAQSAAVLLLNERTAGPWKVTVDGKPAPSLRCNYLMQGVLVPAGDHMIEFRFQPPILPLYVSLAAFASGLVLAAFLMYTHWSPRAGESADPPSHAGRPPPSGKVKG